MPEVPDMQVDVSDSGGSRFQTVLALLIAFVTIVGAVIAWQAALLSEQAADADFSSTVAIINREQVTTVGTARGYQRYRAYTDYQINRTIVEALKDAEAFPEVEVERANASNNIISNLDFIDSRYLDQDGNYDLERDFKTSLADARLENELEPEVFYEEAIQVREKVEILVQDFIILAISLFFFTFAEGLHHQRRFLRYSLTLLGLITLVICIAIAFNTLSGGA